MLTLDAEETLRPEIADRLRERRDQTVQDCADNFIRPSDKAALTAFILDQAAQEDETRRYHEGEALKGALMRILNTAREAGVRDLDGATVMITLDDLVATATMHIPDRALEPITVDPAEVEAAR